MACAGNAACQYLIPVCGSNDGLFRPFKPLLSQSRGSGSFRLLPPGRPPYLLGNILWVFPSPPIAPLCQVPVQFSNAAGVTIMLDTRGSLPQPTARFSLCVFLSYRSPSFEFLGQDGLEFNQIFVFCSSGHLCPPQDWFCPHLSSQRETHCSLLSEPPLLFVLDYIDSKT